MPEDEELEKLRQEKMEEMQSESEDREEAMEQQKKRIWEQAKDYMNDEALDRLSNIRTVDEPKAYSVARQIVTLGSSGRVEKVDGDQMKDILREIQKDSQKNDSNIKFRKG